MGNRQGLAPTPKALLVLACACAFLAVFATFDTSEQYRAWRTARGWTERQKTVAPAMDAAYLHLLSLSALADLTAVVVLSFASILMLSIAVAMDSDTSLKAAEVLAWTALVLGLAYSGIMVVYRLEVWPRIVLKGPVFDYNVGLQPPIVLASGGFPLACLLYLVAGFRKRRIAP